MQRLTVKKLGGTLDHLHQYLLIFYSKRSTIHWKTTQLSIKNSISEILIIFKRRHIVLISHFNRIHALMFKKHISFLILCSPAALYILYLLPSETLSYVLSL